MKRSKRAWDLLEPLGGRENTDKKDGVKRVLDKLDEIYGVTKEGFYHGKPIACQSFTLNR